MGALKDWYSPYAMMPIDKQVHWGKAKLDWIIAHYEVLSDGRWPQKSSGYIENPFAPPSKRIPSGAMFEDPASIMAEFHSRLNLCGRDGEIFRCIECLKGDKPSVGLIAGVDESRLDRVIGQVYSYIRGRRKDRPYQEFRRH